MILTRLIEEMLAAESAEFEKLTVLLPVEDCSRVRDLANRLGVPASRLLAELVCGALAEAEGELRMALLSETAERDPAPTPVLSMKAPPRIK